MFLVAGILIYVAIAKKHEPLPLIPIGFGTILANLPLADMGSYGEGIIALIYQQGIRKELLPPVISLGVGVLTDFRPLLGRPLTFLLGAAGVSAVPMAARVVQKFVSDETDGKVNPLFPAMGTNVTDVIGSAVAAGVFLTLIS